MDHLYFCHGCYTIEFLLEAFCTPWTTCTSAMVVILLSSYSRLSVLHGPPLVLLPWLYFCHTIEFLLTFCTPWTTCISAMVVILLSSYGFLYSMDHLYFCHGCYTIEFLLKAFCTPWTTCTSAMVVILLLKAFCTPWTTCISAMVVILLSSYSRLSVLHGPLVLLPWLLYY